LNGASSYAACKSSELWDTHLRFPCPLVADPLTWPGIFLHGGERFHGDGRHEEDVRDAIAAQHLGEQTLFGELKLRFSPYDGEGYPLISFFK
jgi:hypothetical protein